MVRVRQEELRRAADEYRRAAPAMRRAIGPGLRVLVGEGLVRAGMRILDARRA
jgi:hypothetical protein